MAGEFEIYVVSSISSVAASVADGLQVCAFVFLFVCTSNICCRDVFVLSGFARILELSIMSPFIEFRLSITGAVIFEPSSAPILFCLHPLSIVQSMVYLVCSTGFLSLSNHQHAIGLFRRSLLHGRLLVRCFTAATVSTRQLMVTRLRSSKLHFITTARLQRWLERSQPQKYRTPSFTMISTTSGTSSTGRRCLSTRRRRVSQ